MNDASKTLHSLKLKKCTIQSLANISGLHFPCLHTLDIDSGGAAAVSTIIRASPALRLLKLNNVSSSIDTALQALSDRHSHLISLNLTECKSFSEGVLQAALGSFTQLKTVQFESMSDNFSDACMAALATSCTQLTKLTLSKCAGLTDASMEAIATPCHFLQVFLLGQCGAITLFGAQRVILACKNLTRVKLNGGNQLQPLSPGWGLVPLAAALSACGRVTHLNLQGLDCNAAVWHALAANGTNLQYLCLLKLREMTDLEGLAEVAWCTARLTKLAIHKDETRLYPALTAFWKALQPGLTVYPIGK
jgi:hypothetical protein